MRRLALLLILAALPLALASTASGEAPTRISFTIDDTFYAPFTSFVCGFDVYIHQQGTIKVTLFSDGGGSLVRETDTSPGFRTSFFAPSTGRTISYPGQVTAHTTYSAGGALGSAAVVTLTGILHKYDGAPADAGQLVFAGVVVGVDPDGIPLVDFTDDISAHGHFSDDILGDRCAALS
jgi:hypothetical protein